MEEELIQTEKDNSYTRGIIVSIVLHICLLIASLFSLNSVDEFETKAKPAEVLSVTLEGGVKVRGLTRTLEKKYAGKIPYSSVKQTSGAESDEASKEEPKEEELRLDEPSVVEEKSKKEKEQKDKEDREKKRKDKALRQAIEQAKKRANAEQGLDHGMMGSLKGPNKKKKSDDDELDSDLKYEEEAEVITTKRGDRGRSPTTTTYTK